MVFKNARPHEIDEVRFAQLFHRERLLHPGLLRGLHGHQRAARAQVQPNTRTQCVHFIFEPAAQMAKQKRVRWICVDAPGQMCVFCFRCRKLERLFF